MSPIPVAGASQAQVHSVGVAPSPTSQAWVHGVSIGASGASSGVRVHSVGVGGQKLFQTITLANLSRWNAASSSWVSLSGKVSVWDRIALAWHPLFGAVVAPAVVRPGPTNTGVPAGTVLTENRPAGGRLSVTTDNTIIENQDIYGQVYVAAKNVIIRKCKIRGRSATTNEGLVQTTSASAVNVLIEDCELTPDFPSYWLTGILGANYTVRRCNINRTVDGLGAYNTSAPGQPLNVTVEYNWIHDLSFFSPDPNHTNDNQTHNDGFQIQGGTGAIVRFNYFSSYYATDVGTNNRPRPQALSCMLFNNNVGTTGGHVIEDNWFYGGYVPINGIGVPGVDLGRMWRNEFNGDAGGGGTPNVTITLANSTTTGDFGVGTANANFFTNKATPILIRYNA